MLLLGALAPSLAGAQYLNRESYPLWTNEEYENYATFSYRDMRLTRPITGAGQGSPSGVFRLDEEQRVYDPFGFTLLNGTTIYRTEEYRTLAPFGGSTIAKGDIYRDLFQNLIVTSDSHEGWGSSVIVGRGVLARIRPMVLSHSQMNGIRWEGDSRRNRFSLLGSRISDPHRLRVTTPLTRDFATYLFGLHWETQIGSVLRFSTSYANTHITDTLLEKGRGSFRKGVFPVALLEPQHLYVAVSDDSPEDGNGARIHEVEMYVSGELAAAPPEIRGIGDVLAVGQEKLLVSPNLSLENLPHARERQSWLPKSVLFKNLATEVNPKKNFFLDGDVLDGSTDVLEADGFGAVIYRFEVPADAEDVSFRARVSGDYAIDIGAPIRRQRGTQIWGDWRNVARARGDGAEEPRWVEFGYGFPTGLELYGAEAHLRLFGFDVQGDYNVSTQHLVYPTDEGGRLDDRGVAYSLGGQRSFAPSLSVGWELFRVPPDYETSFNYFNDDVGDVRRFEMVEDNDDVDPWPDSWEHDDPLDFENWRDNTIVPASAVEENIYPPTSRALGFGVYPGLDANDDGVPDTNVNANIVPDYLEPFLMYFVESDDFVYGDDTNNNGVVDARENDNKPDYTYERDSKGRHLFFEIKPVSGLRLRLGGHDIDQLAGRGRNRSLYGKVEYVESLTPRLHLDLRHRTKRVQDDIPDPTYLYVLSPEAAKADRGPAQRDINYLLRLRPDPLDFRNSLANLSYARLSYEPIESLDISTTWRYELNHRIEDTFDDGVSQASGDDWSLAAVNKADYAWNVAPKVVVTPMLKWSYRRQDSSVADDTLVDETNLFPIVRADFRPTEQTTLRAGLQGFPFFKHRFRSSVAPELEYDAWHYIVALQNASNYTGYQVSMNVGFRKSFNDFKAEGAGKLEISEFFLQVRTN